MVKVYEDSCPVAASIKLAIEITSELNLTTKYKEVQRPLDD